MTINDANPATMDPREFARLVKKTPTAELRQMMRSERRTLVLDELLTRMPGVFRADRARALDAVIHWVIGDRPDGGVDTYELVIASGTCALSPAPQAEPKLTLALDAVDFLNLVTGNAHPVALVMRGKLKTKGDLALTAKFPTLFDVPKP
ncbi:SCP2 sterol-binding domain-containing protein [Micromonospora sp. NPDC092111]|uniref:SCP2 sterol-binding domain-containing protein n=1 Tax=Micromonospora sp. NPDC092111 TaxID=3364289 RepID=UPI003818B108